MKRRVLALLLALGMCLALTAPAFADGNESAVLLSSEEMMAVLQSTPIEVVKPEKVEQINYWIHAEWDLEESKEDVFHEIAELTQILIAEAQTETEQANAIFQWVAGNLTYDDTALACIQMKEEERTEEQQVRIAQAEDVLYSFVNRRGLCSGYTNLATLMLMTAGLPSAGIGGEAQNGGAHAWSAVYADQKWILFDTTWNVWDISPDYHRHMESIYVPNGIFMETIQRNGEIWCSLLPGSDYPSDIVIPNNVTSIGDWGFANRADVTSVTLHNNITSIGYAAFYECVGLTNVVIPKSVARIGEFGFANCPALKDVFFTGTEAQWEAISFEACNDDLTAAALHCNSAGSARPAHPTNDIVMVNGEAAEPMAYKINNSNYFKLRDVAALLNGSEKQFNVDYDGTQKAVIITTGQGYDKLDSDLQGAAAASGSAVPSAHEVYIDGERVELTAYQINGSNYFQLRELGRTLDFNVGWNEETKSVFIEGGKSYTDAD